jgi:hypothetical protein
MGRPSPATFAPTILGTWCGSVRLSGPQKPDAHSRAGLPRGCARRARWWLCTSESYPNCRPSKDFSDYYKHPVYVCQVE